MSLIRIGKTSRAHRLIAVLGAVLVLLGIAEATERHVITTRIASSVASHVSGPVHVSIGATPALVDVARREVGTATIRSDDASVCGLSDLRVEATAHGLRHGSTTSVQSTRATVTIRPGSFTALAHSVAADLPVQTTIEPASQSVAVALGPGEMVRFTEHVTLRGDRLSFRPQAASVLGQALPASMRRSVYRRLSYDRTLSDLPAGMTPRTIAFADDGISLGLAGGPSVVNGSGGGRGTCGGAGDTFSFGGSGRSA